MPSAVLRRVTTPELLAVLRRQSAAPYHVILWDNRPLRLADVLSLLETSPSQALYFAAPGAVFSDSPGAARN